MASDTARLVRVKILSLSFYWSPRQTQWWTAPRPMTDVPLQKAYPSHLVPPLGESHRGIGRDNRSEQIPYRSVWTVRTSHRRVGSLRCDLDPNANSSDRETINFKNQLKFI